MTRFVMEDIADCRVFQNNEKENKKKFLIFFFKHELIFFECVPKSMIDYVSSVTDPLAKVTSAMTDPLFKVTSSVTDPLAKVTSGVTGKLTNNSLTNGMTNSLKKVTNPISDTMKRTIYDSKNCEHIVYFTSYETKKCKVLSFNETSKEIEIEIEPKKKEPTLKYFLKIQDHPLSSVSTKWNEELLKHTKK
jgi:hypothetical protein